MSKTKEQITFEHTAKGKIYTLDVPLGSVAAFERARSEGNWIRMVELAERVSESITGQVLKDRNLVTFGGRTYAIKSRTCE